MTFGTAYRMGRGLPANIFPVLCLTALLILAPTLCAQGRSSTTIGRSIRRFAPATRIHLDHTRNPGASAVLQGEAEPRRAKVERLQAHQHENGH
jgi:hypothetical protein